MSDINQAVIAARIALRDKLREDYGPAYKLRVEPYCKRIQRLMLEEFVCAATAYRRIILRHGAKLSKTDVRWLKAASIDLAERGAG